MRIRLEFPSIEKALASQENQGGWYVLYQDGRAFWYDMQHTMSDVFGDRSGNHRIMLRTDAQAIAEARREME